MTQLNKFEDLYGRFPSLVTRMTEPNKFKYLTVVLQVYRPR
jgi:hypothetical protein